LLLKHGTGKYDTKPAIDPQPSGMAAEPLAGYRRVCKMHWLPVLSSPILYIRFLLQGTIQLDLIQFGLWQIVIPDSEVTL